MKRFALLPFYLVGFATLLYGCHTAPPIQTIAPSQIAVFDTHGLLPHVNIPRDVNAPAEFPDGALTSVVVTQCNLIVAVYVTMPDGRLLRFDGTAGVSAEKLIEMAYTAHRSERIEVACDDFSGIAPKFERHEPL